MSEPDGLSVVPLARLARHTAWRTGGTCDALVWVHDPERLQEVLDQCREVDWKWTLLGAGTRTVVRDGGIQGVVVRLGTGFSHIVDTDEPGCWDVGAAVPVPALVARALAEGWTGLESLANVPGSVGASLLLDEGWEDAVEEVHVLHRRKVRPMPVDEVQGRNRLVVGCRVRLAPGMKPVVEKDTAKGLDARRAVPPSSWYEPPRKGKLREILGSVELPAVRLRRVAIAAEAPEVLVNLGEGTAADLQLLHKSALARVKKTRGMDLDSRVRWVGERGD